MEKLYCVQCYKFLSKKQGDFNLNEVLLADFIYEGKSLCEAHLEEVV